MLKKIVSVACCAVMSLSLLAVNVSAAGNVGDTEETLKLTTSSVSYTKTARPKYDTTSAYQKCKSTGLPYYSYVYGYYTNGKKYNASGGNKYTFTTGKIHYMINFVRENYNSSPNTYTNNAGMALAPTGAGGITSFNSTILWSPDSV